MLFNTLGSFLELCSVSVCAFDFIFVFGCAKTFSINNCISDHFVRVANTRRSMRAGNLRQKNTAWLAINCGGGGGRSCSEPSAHYRNYQTFLSSVPTNRAVVAVVVSVRRNLMFLRYVSFCFGYVWRRSSSSSSITSKTVFFCSFCFCFGFFVFSSPLHENAMNLERECERARIFGHRNSSFFGQHMLKIAVRACECTTYSRFAQITAQIWPNIIDKQFKPFLWLVRLKC